MISKAKYVFVLLLMLIAIGFLSTNVDAYVLLGGKFTRGVSNTCYYVNSTASAYTNQINAAARNWEVTGYGKNPIYMTAVSSTKGSHMDIYGKNNSFWNRPGIAGETNFFTSSGSKITSFKNNWFYVEIYLNRDSFSELTTNQRQGTIAHEMGHGFGLDDNNNMASIMCQGAADRKIYLVGLDDHNGINAIY